MKRFKPFLILVCTLVLLALTSHNLKAQNYNSCPVSYQQITDAMSSAVESDKLLRFTTITYYPTDSYSLLGKLKIIYSDPRCQSYQPQFKSDLRYFWELVINKKYYHLRKQVELDEIRCESTCGLGDWQSIESCRRSCKARYQGSFSSIQSDELNEKKQRDDFFR